MKALEFALCIVFNHCFIQSASINWFFFVLSIYSNKMYLKIESNKNLLMYRLVIIVNTNTGSFCFKGGCWYFFRRIFESGAFFLLLKRIFLNYFLKINYYNSLNGKSWFVFLYQKNRYYQIYIQMFYFSSVYKCLM